MKAMYSSYMLDNYTEKVSIVLSHTVKRMKAVLVASVPWDCSRQSTQIVSIHGLTSILIYFPVRFVLKMEYLTSRVGLLLVELYSSKNKFQNNYLISMFNSIFFLFLQRTANQAKERSQQKRHSLASKYGSDITRFFVKL